MIKSLEENMKTFSAEVEKRVVIYKLDYMEAILDICEETGMEPSTIKKLMSDNIKSNLFEEAQRKNYITKVGSLPL